MTTEARIEKDFIATLSYLKYSYRADIRDRADLEENFREKFEELNRVTLSEGEFQRFLAEIVSPDVFAAAQTMGINPRRAIEQIVDYKKEPDNGAAFQPSAPILFPMIRQVVAGYL